MINSLKDPNYVDRIRDLSLFNAVCNNCGFDAKFPSVFFYYRGEDVPLWVSSTEDYCSRFLQLKNIASLLANQYLREWYPKDMIAANDQSWQYIPLGYLLLRIGSPLATGEGNGFVHFYPYPKVSIELVDGKDYEMPESLHIPPICIGLVEGNYPDAYQTIWNLLPMEFQFNRQYIQTTRVSEEKRLVETCGLPEIIIYIGSTIIMPLFLGVLSNLISSAILEKRRARKELEDGLTFAKISNNPAYRIIEMRVKGILKAQDNSLTPSDKIRMRFRVAESAKEYIFKGSISEVCGKIVALKKQMLCSVRLDGDCHIANFIGDAISDPCNRPEFVNIAKASEEYEKTFGMKTRLRFAEGEEGKYIKDSVDACHKAKELAKKEMYEDALLILKDLVRGDDTSIEVLYNCGVCLEALGHIEDASGFYEKVLIRIINLPSIAESGSIVIGAELTGPAGLRRTILEAAIKRKYQLFFALKDLPEAGKG